MTTILVAFAAGACDSDNPFEIDFFADVDTAALFSLSRPELDLPGGFDFVRRRAIRVHVPGETGRWDIALDTRDGSLVLLTPGALGISNTSGIAALEGRDFEEVDEAPADSSAFTFDRPVPVEPGTVYVVRTREVTDSFGLPCVRYAKLGPIEIRPGDGVLTFEFDANPRCDDRRLQGDEPPGAE